MRDWATKWRSNWWCFTHKYIQNKNKNRTILNISKRRSAYQTCVVKSVIEWIGHFLSANETHSGWISETYTVLELLNMWTSLKSQAQALPTLCANAFDIGIRYCVRKLWTVVTTWNHYTEYLKSIKSKPNRNKKKLAMLKNSSSTTATTTNTTTTNYCAVDGTGSYN